MQAIHGGRKVAPNLMPSSESQTIKDSHMKSFFRPVLLAGLLATVGFAAFSQAPGGGMMGAGGPMHEGMGKMDPAKMQVRIDKRNAALKAQLKLTAAQEGAWTSYTAAMK